jgi:alpha-ketoglutarate-dependent taurine dioxygenase
MDSIDRLHQTVLQNGWAVLPSLTLDADNASLLALGQRFGKTSMLGNRSGAKHFENDGVNRVENADTPMRDGVGNPALSSTADEFPLHTDDSFAPAPARFVLMHCWQADASGGGQSWVAHVDAVLAIAPPDLIERLASSPYTTPYGSALVLQRDAQNAWRLRFNLRDMIGFAKLRFQVISEQKRKDLTAFGELAMQCVKRISLERGDCIVVDNHRVLHGRSSFDAKSGRLIKRLRIQDSASQ